MANLRVALAQLNLTVGDLSGNCRKILEALLRAKAWRVDLVVVPELAVTGYPPEDLLLKPSFVEDNLRLAHRLAPATRGLTALVGYANRDAQGRLYNAAAVFSDGRFSSGTSGMRLVGHDRPHAMHTWLWSIETRSTHLHMGHLTRCFTAFSFDRSALPGGFVWAGLRAGGRMLSSAAVLP